MELPADVWGVVKQRMTPEEWTKPCGSADSPAVHTLRRPWLATEVRSECDGASGNEQVLLRQLQLKWWPICHSVCINLRQYHEAPTLTQAQIKQIELAAKAMPSLSCLHIIGRESVNLTKSSIEGVLVGILARQAAVLTLQVERVLRFPDLPNLRHLALDIDIPYEHWEHDSVALFSAISVLKGLTTLFLSSSSKRYLSGCILFRLADLTECVHLRHVGLHGIILGEAQIPPGCHLHVNDIPKHWLGFMHEADNDHMTTGLTMRHRSGMKWLHMRHGSWFNRPRTRATIMHSLRHLRVTLDKETVLDRPGPWCGSFTIDVYFAPDTAPGLEVLEMDVQGGLFISIDLLLPLKALVLIAAGKLQLSEPVWRKAPRIPLKEMYLQSGTAFLPYHEAVSEASYAKGSWAALLKDSEFVRQEQGHWTTCMPATFTPCNLQECCCGACLGCLVRAGVPVDCEQGWTGDGFEEHQRRYWQRGALKSRSP